MPQKRRCEKCSCGRSGLTCFKCGSKTVACPGFEEPGLPSVELIRALAKEVGYAIGLHGSLERDLDVIAAPWTEDAVGNYALMEHLAAGMNAHIISIERKPLGRYAATLQVDGWFKPIDLSVCPRESATHDQKDRAANDEEQPKV